MNLIPKILVGFVVIFHATIFVIEVFFWMHPGVYQIALARLTDRISLDLHDQALVLKTTFVNLGFYNLFLAAAGISGFVALARGNAAVGRALIGYMCLSAVGAGLVLLLSTHAYVGAFLQAVPAVVALALMFATDSSRLDSAQT